MQKFLQNKRINWIGYILITLFFLLLCHLWKDWIIYNFDGSHHGNFFRENRWSDVVELASAGPWEEAVFRVIPFLAGSFLIVFSKPKWLKWLFGIIISIVIIVVQLQFAALHYSGFYFDEEWAEMLGDTLHEDLIIQGVFAMFVVCAYLCSLLYYRKTHKISDDTKTKVKHILLANLIAYCVCTFIHSSSNVLLVFTQTF